MEDYTITITPAMAALVPVVAAILQVLKRMEAVHKMTEWLPFFSVGIALGLSYLTRVPDPVLSSVVIGLVASGGYDLLKAPAAGSS